MLSAALPRHHSPHLLSAGARRTATSNRTPPAKLSTARFRPCRPSGPITARCPTPRCERAWRPYAPSSASASARLCLEFLVLTATRSGEARGARWDEIDLEAREWRIAADRMKTSNLPRGSAQRSRHSDSRPGADARRRTAHIPLAHSTKPAADSQRHDANESAAHRRLRGQHNRPRVPQFLPDLGQRVHRVRSRGYGAVPVARRSGNTVERAYARSDLLEKRRTLMAQWAAECATPSAGAPAQRPSSICPGLDGPQPGPLAESAGARLTSPHQPAPIPHHPSIDLDPAAVPPGKLTTDTVLAISKPGRYSDGRTLYLQVANTGAKSWIQRIVIGGRRRDIGLGGFPVVSTRKGPRPSHGKPGRAVRGPRSPARDATPPRTRTGQLRTPSAFPTAIEVRSRDPCLQHLHRRRQGPTGRLATVSTTPARGPASPVRADSLTRYRGQVVGFCNPDCRDKFEAAVRHFEQSAAHTARV